MACAIAMKTGRHDIGRRIAAAFAAREQVLSGTAQMSGAVLVTEHHGKTTVVALATLLDESEQTGTEKLFGFGHGGLLNGKSPRWRITKNGHRGIAPIGGCSR